MLISGESSLTVDGASISVMIMKSVTCLMLSRKLGLRVGNFVCLKIVPMENRFLRYKRNRVI